MTGWHAGRAPGRMARVTIGLTLLTLLLIAAVPVALLVAVILMVAGHAVVGLALFGGTVLAAGLAATLAGMTGLRQARKLLASVPRAGWLDASQAPGTAEDDDPEYDNLVHLDRSDYTEVR